MNATATPSAPFRYRSGSAPPRNGAPIRTQEQSQEVGDDFQPFRVVREKGLVKVFDLPLVDEHDVFGEDGKFVCKCDERMLAWIAANNNKQEKETGDTCPISLGHTIDGVPEIQQPPIVGECSGFYVAPLVNQHTGEPTGRKAIYARTTTFTEEDVKKYDLKRFPRRSVEIWFDKDPIIDPVALLGSSTPERSLGVLRLSRSGKTFWHHSIGGQQRPVRRKRPTSLIQPGVRSTSMSGSYDQDDFIARVVAAVTETEPMQFLRALMTNPQMMEAYLAHMNPPEPPDPLDEALDMPMQPEMPAPATGDEQMMGSPEGVDTEIEQDEPFRNARKRAATDVYPGHHNLLDANQNVQQLRGHLEDEQQYAPRPPLTQIDTDAWGGQRHSAHVRRERSAGQQPTRVAGGPPPRPELVRPNSSLPRDFYADNRRARSEVRKGAQAPFGLGRPEMVDSHTPKDYLTSEGKLAPRKQARNQQEPSAGAYMHGLEAPSTRVGLSGLSETRSPGQKIYRPLRAGPAPKTQLAPKETAMPQPRRHAKSKDTGAAEGEEVARGDYDATEDHDNEGWEWEHGKGQTGDTGKEAGMEVLDDEFEDGDDHFNEGWEWHEEEEGGGACPTCGHKHSKPVRRSHAQDAVLPRLKSNNPHDREVRAQEAIEDRWVGEEVEEEEAAEPIRNAAHAVMPEEFEDPHYGEVRAQAELEEWSDLEVAAEQGQEPVRHERVSNPMSSGGNATRLNTAGPGSKATKLAPPSFQKNAGRIPRQPTTMPMRPSQHAREANYDTSALDYAELRNPPSGADGEALEFAETRNPPSSAKHAKTTQMAPPTIRVHGLPNPKKPTTAVPRSTRLGTPGKSPGQRSEGRQAAAATRRNFDESWGQTLHGLDPAQYERAGGPVRRSATAGSVAGGANTFVPREVPGENDVSRYRNPSENLAGAHLDMEGVGPVQQRRHVKRMRTTYSTAPQQMPDAQEVYDLREQLESLRMENENLRIRQTRSEQRESMLIRNARQRAFRERLARCERDIVQLEGEGYVLDRNEEMEEVKEMLRTGTFSPERWDRKLDVVRKRYQKSPTGGTFPFRTDMVQAPTAAAQPAGMTSKDQMYAAAKQALAAGPDGAKEAYMRLATQATA